MKTLVSVVFLALLCSCGQNTKNKAKAKPLSIEEHYQEAAKLMCDCLEESLKDTSSKSIGNIMNECEAKSVRTYRTIVSDSIMVDTTDSENVSYFSIGMVQSLDSVNCKALSQYKAKLWNDAIKSD